MQYWVQIQQNCVHTQPAGIYQCENTVDCCPPTAYSWELLPLGDLRSQCVQVAPPAPCTNLPDLLYTASRVKINGRNSCGTAPLTKICF